MACYRETRACTKRSTYSTRDAWEGGFMGHKGLLNKWHHSVWIILVTLAFLRQGSRLLCGGVSPWSASAVYCSGCWDFGSWPSGKFQVNLVIETPRESRTYWCAWVMPRNQPLCHGLFRMTGFRDSQSTFARVAAFFRCFSKEHCLGSTAGQPDGHGGRRHGIVIVFSWRLVQQHGYFVTSLDLYQLRSAFLLCKAVCNRIDAREMAAVWWWNL